MFDCKKIAWSFIIIIYLSFFTNSVSHSRTYYEKTSHSSRRRFKSNGSITNYSTALQLPHLKCFVVLRTIRIMVYLVLFYKACKITFHLSHFSSHSKGKHHRGNLNSFYVIYKCNKSLVCYCSLQLIISSKKIFVS